ncbi:MAG: flavodoxin family protein, partial [Candidatus Hydrogenedentes bacterium]|nr:flavodoxin family protein [Candidatus Hydrogenedentota bacterium]
MKIVAVLGSPRLNGNSAFIAGRFLEAAKDRGAETQSFALNALTYRGCQACMSSKKTSEVCVLKDDLSEVLEAVREAGVIVLASPVYYGDVTGQMKLFIDRTYCYLTPDYHTNPQRSRLVPGKTVVFVQTQGLADVTVFADVFPRYREVMKFIGINEAFLLRGCGLTKRDDVCGREDLLKQAE